MPFVVPYAPSQIYQPNGRLVDLLRLQGEQTAEGQRRAGEIQAQMWGNLGQSISQGVGNVIKAQQDAPAIADAKMKLQDAQQLRQGQQLIDRSMQPQTPQGPAEGGGNLPATHPFLDDNGLADPTKVKGLLDANGLGHLAPQLLKGIEDQNTTILNHQKLQEQLGQTQTLLIGDISNTAQTLHKGGIPIDKALDIASASALATKRFAPQQYAQVKAQILSLPPEQQDAALGSFMDAAAQISPEKDLTEGATRLDRYNRQKATNPKQEKPTEASLAATANDQSKTPAERAAATASLAALQAPTTTAHEETSRHNKEMERIAGLTEGKAEASQRETERHNRATEAAINPFGGTAVGASGAAGPTGDEFLKTLPVAAQGQVKALAEGRQPFPTGMSYAKLQPLIAAVTQYDPTFDAANYTARSKARTDLTSPSGTGGKTINSLNTAIQHLGRLSDLIETENNSNIPLVNSVVNPLRTAVGSTAVTNFNAVQPQAMKEIERLWRGAGGSEGDINALKDSLSKNAGQQQQREALQEFVNLVRGKLDSTEQQRDNIMGAAGKGVPVLFEQNKPILEKIGQRANGTSGALTVTAPDGSKHQFDTQAQADAFKKLAGMK